MGNAHAMKPMPSADEVKESASRTSGSRNSRRDNFDTESLASTIIKKRAMYVGNKHARAPLPSLGGGRPADRMDAEELAFAVLEKVEGLPELDIALAKDDISEVTDFTQEMTEMTEGSSRLSIGTDRYSRASSTSNSNSNTRRTTTYKKPTKQVQASQQKLVEDYISKMDSSQILRKLERMSKTDEHAKELLRAVRINGEIVF